MPVPVAEPPAPVAVAPPADPVMIVRPARPAEPEAAPDPEDTRPRLLVVEDNADTRMLLDRILRATYHVTAVADARSALIEMNRHRFRGLVLDINLGGKETGADVLRVARTLDGYEGVYAIALTAYALPGDRDRLLEAGFDEYLSKPFTRQALLDTLAAGIRA
jgi:CheY-like chemotaxis protein